MAFIERTLLTDEIFSKGALLEVDEADIGDESLVENVRKRAKVALTETLLQNEEQDLAGFDNVLDTSASKVEWMETV